MLDLMDERRRWKHQTTEMAKREYRRLNNNPDLNPVEAQQAYLLRKQRRESRQGSVISTGVGDNPVLNPMAQPFSATSG